jgi:hypothetical protein
MARRAFLARLYAKCAPKSPLCQISQGIRRVPDVALNVVLLRALKEAFKSPLRDFDF